MVEGEFIGVLEVISWVGLCYGRLILNLGSNEKELNISFGKLSEVNIIDEIHHNG